MDIGMKIRELRKSNSLTLEELASRSELSKGFLSQVERNLTSPSISTLEDILEALGTSLGEFFKDEKEEKIVFSKEDYFEDERQGYSISWIVPNAQKNEMEPILLKIDPHEKSMVVTNHQGEEFGYVLRGNVVLELEGGRKHRIRTQETFYLSGKEAHTLCNPYSAPALVLWVSTPPVF